MSAEREILKYLSESKTKRVIRYKGIRTGFLGLPDFKHYKYQTLANKCSSLKQKGFIKEINGTYLITEAGERFLSKKEKIFFKTFTSLKSEKDPKNLLIIYDIPQDQTSIRNWFRRELRVFHFVMIQRSVWVGPSPLPKEFLDYLKEIKIMGNFKSFKLQKGYKFEK